MFALLFVVAVRLTELSNGHILIPEGDIFRASLIANNLFIGVSAELEVHKEPTEEEEIFSPLCAK